MIWWHPDMHDNSASVRSTTPHPLLKAITDRLVEALAPEQIWIFGSHAWGAPSPESDADVLVIVADSDVSPARRGARAHRALRGIDAPVDVIVKTRAEVERYRGVPASLVHKVLTEGTLVYG